MKKRDKKLRLNRETVRQLDSRDLGKAHGGKYTSCMEPNCCGDIDTLQQHDQVVG
jgi:hypothetical protein